MEPFYFGTSKQSLFGIYHAPNTRLARDCAAVLCYPMGQEYIRSHRAYRELSLRLSRAGFPVLRFDFYGCGDSAGECEQGHLGHWVEDVGAAVSEMRRRSGRSKIGLIGLRLGATVSMIAGAELGEIDRMVLWDPVVDGKAHLAELFALHEERLTGYPQQPDASIAGADQPVELLGFPFSDFMLQDLRRVDLLTVRRRPANRVLLLLTGGTPIGERLQKHLEAIDTPIECQSVPSAQVWLADMNQDKGLVPARVLQAIVSWMSKNCS